MSHDFELLLLALLLESSQDSDHSQMQAWNSLEAMRQKRGGEKYRWKRKMMICLTLLNPNKKERSGENSSLQPFHIYIGNCLITLLGHTKHFFLKMKGIPWICIFIFLFFHLFNFNYHLTAASWFLLSSAFDYYLILYCSSVSKTQIFHNHLV